MVTLARANMRKRCVSDSVKAFKEHGEKEYKAQASQSFRDAGRKKVLSRKLRGGDKVVVDISSQQPNYKLGDWVRFDSRPLGAF